MPDRIPAPTGPVGTAPLAKPLYFAHRAEDNVMTRATEILFVDPAVSANDDGPSS